MRCIGITNKVEIEGIKNPLYVFFAEFDNVELRHVNQCALFLSNRFKIDIYLLESSKDSYHLVSFDIITKEKLKHIEAWKTLDSNYLGIDECMLYRKYSDFQVLRVSAKGQKPMPKLIYTYCQAKQNLISAGHHYLYKGLGIILQDIPTEYLVKTTPKLISYDVRV